MGKERIAIYPADGHQFFADSHAVPCQSVYVFEIDNVRAVNLYEIASGQGFLDNCEVERDGHVLFVGQMDYAVASVCFNPFDFVQCNFGIIVLAPYKGVFLFRRFVTYHFRPGIQRKQVQNRALAVGTSDNPYR